MSKHPLSVLRPQALRLPQRACDHLKALVRELRAVDEGATAAKAMRGLCLLALELSTGSAGAKVAEAFRIVARDPTPAGECSALKAVCSLVDGEPPTNPMPPAIDVAVPAPPDGSSRQPPVPPAE